MKKTDAVPFLSAKVVRGLWLSQGPKPLGLSGKSPHLRVVFSAKTLCKPAPLSLFCCKKDELLRTLPEKEMALFIENLHFSNFTASL